MYTSPSLPCGYIHIILGRESNWEVDIGSMCVYSSLSFYLQYHFLVLIKKKHATKVTEHILSFK